jgi:hypothetical protein
MRSGHRFAATRSLCSRTRSRHAGTPPRRRRAAARMPRQRHPRTEDHWVASCTVSWPPSHPARVAEGLRAVLARSADPREFAVLREVLGARTPSRAATSAADMDRGKPAPDPVEVAPQNARIAPEQVCSQAIPFEMGVPACLASACGAEASAAGSCWTQEPGLAAAAHRAQRPGGQRPGRQDRAGQEDCADPAAPAHVGPPAALKTAGPAIASADQARDRASGRGE